MYLRCKTIDNVKKYCFYNILFLCEAKKNFDREEIKRAVGKMRTQMYLHFSSFVGNCKICHCHCDNVYFGPSGEFR